MNTKRLNITLPEKIAEALEGYNNKSRFIAEALVEKIQRDNKEKIDRLLAEGYKKEAQQGKAIDRDWEAITMVGWPE